MATRSAAVGVLLAMLSFGGCMSPAPGPTPIASMGVLRYVALGDSYTIGTSVNEAERWPNQLVDRLGPAAPTLALVANLGVNGRTSGDVIRDQLPQLDSLRPDFVSLLIGVNDLVQGVPIEAYRANLGTILDVLLARLPAGRIVAVSIPDYTVTPAGADYGDPTTQSAAIRAENAILGELSAARGIAFVDIYDLSLRAADDPALVADDGLHPSGAQYALWVGRIAPVVATLIGRAGP
jgi:lysophospholipase L1-like esterase